MEQTPGITPLWRAICERLGLDPATSGIDRVHVDLPNLGRGTLQRLKEASASPRLSTLQKIASALGCDVSELLAATAPGASAPQIERLQRVATIGQAAMALGAAVAGLSESRRKTISALVAAQIYDKPDSQEAQAIDALAPGLTVAVPAGWRELAHRTATSHPDAAVREILTKFVDEIDRQAHAGSHAPEHPAKSILKI